MRLLGKRAGPPAGDVVVPWLSTRKGGHVTAHRGRQGSPPGTPDGAAADSARRATAPDAA
ncbi:hypothetical protein PJI17_25930 [Mycobacterium kansasii]